MPITLKNYRKELSRELVLLAEKNTVRECDETEKGHFVAYVDEGSNSYDVSLNISPKGEVDKGTCDCEAKTPFCRHKAALLIQLATGKKTKATVTVKRKQSQVETLLDEADFTGLKEWVKTLVQKNKDIELAFVHHFSAGKHEYTAEEVAKLVKDTIKAAIGNKKTIDATQLKKLVELWGNVLKPVVDYYQANVMEEKAFQCLQTIIDRCANFQAGISGNSNKIPKYIEGILQQSEPAIHNLQNDAAFDTATTFFVTNIPDGPNQLRMPYLLHLQNILEATSTERRAKLINALAVQAKKIDPEVNYDGALYVKALFKIIEGHHLFPQYYNIFKPITFDNEFNLKLIALLIENNHLGIAEKFCRAQIKLNYNDQYSIPYYQQLKTIYTAQKDEGNLAIVIEVLFPYTYDFEDYLFILKSMQPEDGKKWRNKIFTKARYAARGYDMPQAAIFCFRLADHEKSYKKMIGYIDSYTPYELILQYFEPMVLADKAKLLSEIINKKDDSWSTPLDVAEKDKAFFPGLFDMMVKHYKVDYLDIVVRQATKPKQYYSNPGRFVLYMKERLKEFV